MSERREAAGTPPDRRPTTHQVGAAKERLAEDYLRRQQLRPLARNHRCRHGEIDLIMRDEQSIVFVEVRYRHSSRFGTAAETVDLRKQRRLAAAADHYLQAHPTPLPCRFDVVAISEGDQIEWIKNAFSVET